MKETEPHFIHEYNKFYNVLKDRILQCIHSDSYTMLLQILNNMDNSRLFGETILLEKAIYHKDVCQKTLLIRLSKNYSEMDALNDSVITKFSLGNPDHKGLTKQYLELISFHLDKMELIIKYLKLNLID